MEVVQHSRLLRARLRRKVVQWLCNRRVFQITNTVKVLPRVPGTNMASCQVDQEIIEPKENATILTNHRKNNKEDSDSLAIIGVRVGQMVHLTSITICHDSVNHAKYEIGQKSLDTLMPSFLVLEVRGYAAE